MKQQIPEINLPDMFPKRRRHKTQSEPKDCEDCEFWQVDCFIRDVNGACVKWKKRH